MPRLFPYCPNCERAFKSGAVFRPEVHHADICIWCGAFLYVEDDGRMRIMEEHELEEQPAWVQTGLHTARRAILTHRARTETDRGRFGEGFQPNYRFPRGKPPI